LYIYIVAVLFLVIGKWKFKKIILYNPTNDQGIG